jgi:hypothetical protein
VTTKVAEAAVLELTVRRYDPASRLDGSVATTLLLVDETTVNFVLPRITAGATVEGLKLLPLIVICFVAESTRALTIAGSAVAAHWAVLAVSTKSIGIKSGRTPEIRMDIDEPQYRKMII